MASMTVTNLQATSMNALDAYTGGGSGPAALSATGGARKDPLPHPFQHVVLGPSGSSTQAKTLIVHQRDWRNRGMHGKAPHEAGEEWNMLFQAKKVSLSLTLSAGDVEDGAEAAY